MLSIWMSFGFRISLVMDPQGVLKECATQKASPLCPLPGILTLDLIWGCTIKFKLLPSLARCANPPGKRSELACIPKKLAGSMTGLYFATMKH